MSLGRPSSTRAAGRRTSGDHQVKNDQWGIVSQVITKIKDEPFLFVIAVIALLIAFAVAASKLGSPDLRFIVVVIALLAFTVIVGHYGMSVVLAHGKPSETEIGKAAMTATNSETREATKSDVVPVAAVAPRNSKYDRWKDELSDGFLEVTHSPRDIDEWNTLARILNAVLREKKFGETVTGNANVIFSEFLSNVGRHAKDSDATVTLELNTVHLPKIGITVGDTGKGCQWWANVEEQYLGMRAGGREHGLGRVCRLSDYVLSTHSGGFRIWCTLYDIPWPGTLCDEYLWCERVLLDYTSPPSVWFGSRRYPLWWRDENGGWSTIWSALGALNFSLDNEIPQIMHLYLEHMRVKEAPYVFFEVRGHGFTETGMPRMSYETISQTLESYFARQLASKKVLLYRSQGAYAGSLRSLSEEYGLALWESDKQCVAELRKIDDRISSSRSMLRQ